MKEQTVVDINQHTNALFPGEKLRLTGIDDSIYHATNGLGSTALKYFMNSPAKYDAYSKNLLTFSSKSMDLGSAVHCKVLEPHLFRHRYQLLPEDIKVKRGKKWDALREQSPDAVFFNHSDYQKIIAISTTIKSKYGAFFDTGEPEVSYWKRDLDTGLLLKSRIDWESGDLAIDLKTTASAQPSLFNKSANDYGYWLQEALYIDVTGLSDFLFMVVETEQPYLSTLDAYTDDDKAFARNQYKAALDRLKQCHDKDEWPGYASNDEICELTIPQWKRNQITGDL